MTAPAVIPTRDQWPEWVENLVAQKESFIDQRDAQLDELTTALAAKPEPKSVVALNSVSVAPTMTIQALKEREQFIEEFINEFFVYGKHYGPPYPNAKKNALHKAGAEWLLAAFELRPDFIEIEKVVERTPGSLGTGLISYEYRCELHLRSFDGPIIGSAIGICSSEEEKYKYRNIGRVCPQCGEETIRRGAKKYGGGWYCNKNDGGCGASFKGGTALEKEIDAQETRKEINPDLGGLQHTIAAMAQKRAFVLAVRTATGVSAYFSDEVADEDTEDKRFTVNSTATVRGNLASKANDLIDYALTLLPSDHTFTRGQVGASCLNALGLKEWGQLYGGTLDDAKADIKQAITGGQDAGATEDDQPAEAQPEEPGIPEVFDTSKEDPDVPSNGKTRRQPLGEKAEEADPKCLRCEKADPTGEEPFPFLCADCARAAGDEEAVAQDAAK